MADSRLNKKNFEDIIDHKKVGLFLLKNSAQMQVAITNYGGRIVSLKVPDQDGNLIETVLGFDNIKQYQTSTEPYFGAIIGRYGNRIADGKFSIDGKHYELDRNSNGNSLHGGKGGFHNVVWQPKLTDDQNLELTYFSKDMEEGFPGNLEVKVTYSLTNNNQLVIDYEASTDRKTVVNLSNHAFFNLNGEENRNTINNHLLTIFAGQYLPVNKKMIPTGEFASVNNTPFDFRKPALIGARIDIDHEQIKNGRGYDHSFVLNDFEKNTLKLAAIAEGENGLIMEVFTEEPGLQFYSGNFLQSKNTLRGGGKDDFRSAFCIETQHFPDSPNQPAFPTTILEPGKMYKTRTVYGFKNRLA